MWVSGDWRDFELLDCSAGQRLERWGKHSLVRPDPQVIWDTPRRHPLWQKPDARYLRSAEGGGRWQNHSLPERWEISYRTLRFFVRPTNFKHTGLFPEQAVNWDALAALIRDAGRPVSVLNLFAYTGGATLTCAEAGAEVCHVDAARGMVNWARENAELSGLAARPIRWIVDDCREFAGREIRRGRKYDLIVMDPPSYGRGAGGEVWKIEDDLYGFLSLCAELLSERPLGVFLNSYTTGLAPGVLTYLLDSVFSARFGGRALSEELGLPVSEGRKLLPCGATGRWMPY